VHTICYTSGTTGVPKGVVLTHANLVANAAGIHGYAEILPSDVYLSYLPLAHIYERVNQLVLLVSGAGIGFYGGDVLKIVDDIQALRPTIFASVPRLWNRIYDRVTATIAEAGPVAQGLFNAAFRNRAAMMERGQRPHGVLDAAFDRLVFAKIRDRLGGRVRLMITGASPISPAVFNFLRCCFCPDIMEGYGMTESACVITLTQPGDPVSGHVGGPTPAMEVKLADLPEMGYTNADSPYPRGEICVRGPAVFQGYFKDDAQTREVLDPDGWLHTGDVGMWIPGGRLRIFDRKKNIFKLAQGEYVAPEKIEQVYQRCPLVAQCFVHGDSLRPNLVAVVVPDPETLVPWAKRQGLPGDFAALCRRVPPPPGPAPAPAPPARARSRPTRHLTACPAPPRRAQERGGAEGGAGADATGGAGGGASRLRASGRYPAGPRGLHRRERDADAHVQDQAERG